MILSMFCKNEAQSTKWNRLRINYDLLERVLRAKEYMDNEPKPKQKLRIKTVIGY